MSFIRYLLLSLGLWCLGLLLPRAALAQVPAWQLAVSVGTQPGSSYTLVKATATDGAGSVYVAGFFTGTLTVGTTVLTSAGGEDVFIAKWDVASASFAWAQRAGGPANDQASTLAVVDNDVYVGGTFMGTAAFGTFARTSAGYTDAFVAKWRTTGPTATVQWVQVAGGPNYDDSKALAATANGVYWLGGFLYSAQLGSLTLSSPNFSTMFLARLTDAGASSTVGWAQVVEGAGTNWWGGLAVQGNALYLSSVFSNSLTLGTITLAGTGSFNLFVAKLLDTGTAGTYQWAVASTNTGTPSPNALAVGPAGVYVVGEFFGTIGLGTTTLLDASTGVGGGDMFVAKLTDAGTSGSFGWAQRAGGPANDLATAVAVRGSQVYVVGAFSGAVSFGPHTLTSLGPGNDCFVTRLTDAGTTGTFAWAERAGGTGFDLASAVAVAGSGPVYVAGTLVPPATFGSLSVGPAATDFRGFLAAFTEGAGLPTAGALPPLALLVYPSPTHGRATVQLPAGLDAGRATLTLLDALGRVVRTRTATLTPGTTQTDFDVAGLAPGVYALRLAVGQRLGTARLVVE